MTIAARQSAQNRMAEWLFSSAKEYANPFDDIELSAVFEVPDGAEMVIPAYWAGGHAWGLRYASHKLGRHRFRTVCSDPANSDLHGREGLLEVIPYHGTPCLRTVRSG